MAGLLKSCVALLTVLAWAQVVCQAAWEEHELDRLAVGGEFSGDSLHLEDGLVVATWSRKPEEGSVTVWQSEWDGGFSTPVVVADGGTDWWGGTALMVGGDEYLAVQRPGPDVVPSNPQARCPAPPGLGWQAESPPHWQRFRRYDFDHPSTFPPPNSHPKPTY